MINMMTIYSNLRPSLPKTGADIFVPLYPKWDLILGSNPIMLGAPNIDPNTPHRISLLGKKWTYRGEGNMNLVLSLPEERVILRLHKCLGDNSSVGQQGVSNKTERERVWREAVFCHGIMVPLLGKAYIQPPQTACMELFEVLVLDSELRAQRPAFRHHKSLQYGYVTIYPDYALLPKHLEIPGISSTPTFCVEIKPKQGWLPPVDRRLSKCTFCLNQYLKAKKGLIRTRSSYCPLDLFSGIRTRMIKALKALLNNPQNNLKIFKNGVLVYDDDKVEQLAEVLSDWFGDSDAVDPQKKSRLIDYMCDLVLQALTRNLMVGCQKNQNFTNIYATWDRGCLELLRPFSVPAKPVPVYCNEKVPSSLVDKVRPLLPLPSCDWKSEPLPSDCILDRILHAQKLEKYGGDRVYEMYCSWLEGIREQNEDESRDYEYISGMLTAGAGEGRGLSPIHRHLIATTAKDCSIMIAFQSLPSGFSKMELPSEHVAQGRDGHQYAINVGVTDLDPKPISCIEAHRKRDIEVLKACIDSLGSSVGGESFMPNTIKSDK